MAKPVVRLRVVQVAFGLAVLAVLVRAAQVQVVRGAAYRGITFKEGYLNRRINITMLYGEREKR